MSWAALHVHSQYSILDSTISLTKLAAKAKASGMSAVALTDSGNLYGAVEFFKACKEAGIKPLLGCELSLAPTSRFEKKRVGKQPTSYPLILLVKNKKGYENLCKLSSLAHLEGFYYVPRIDKELLAKHHEGLICLSGPLHSRLAQCVIQENEEELISELKWYQELFGEDFFLEVQRHPMSEAEISADEMRKEAWAYQNYEEWIAQEEKVIRRYRELGREHGIRCVATCDVRYLEREDWRAHEVLMNIQSGEPCEIWERDSQGNPKNRILNPKRQTFASHAHNFKSPEEMRTLFSDFPEAVDTAQIIVDRCQFEMDFKTKYYPVFVPPQMEGTTFTKEEREKAAEIFLRQLCEEGVKKRYTPERLLKVKEKYPTRDPLEIVRERLAYELEIIISKGMGDYLLIVWDFIAWAKRQGIPMGPGRGSGAGSIVLYLIEITDIEPLRFSLFFERFINPERLSYPDIDVDICMDRRGEVIDYTIRKYGKDKVAQIMTFGTMKAKMAIKDVGRVLSIPLAKVNAIAKLVPEDPNMTLEKAFELDPLLRQQYETDEEVRRCIDLAKILEGSVRNTGIHAAGLIISADPIMERIPVCVAKDTDIVVTQFSMKPVETVGMLKIDFLGLKTLTSIQIAVDSIKANHGISIDWVDLPLEDKKTFALLNQGKTLGIFQVESAGMQDLAKQLHIDCFEEIIAVGALYRPGPMEMIPSFVQRKHGKEQIEIDHPLMKGILSETYGIMVYQEQVMQIASLLAGYTLGEGDVLRRAMGKKDREEMMRQREKFRLGALKNGIDEQTSMRIFDKVEKFASYGFNKSHAAAYGFLTYVTSYLKANYPREWMAALMTSDRDDLTKVAKVIGECQTMGIAILPPDVNISGKEFVATEEGIRFAITAIKGIGEGVVESIVEERKQRGSFKSLADFFKRVDTKKVGKKAVEHLIEAGCFDFTGWSRQSLIAAVDPLFATSSRDQKEAERGVISLFSLVEEESVDLPPEIEEREDKQKILRREKELLGFYLTGHPMDEFKPLLQRLSCVPLSRFNTLDKGAVVRSAFILETVNVKLGQKNQRKFAILTISDGVERLELPIWSDLYEQQQALLVENQLIYAVLVVDREDHETIKLQCRWMGDLTQASEEMIYACDQAYDRAKMQVKMTEFRQRAPEKTQQAAKKEAPKPLKLTLNADAARLTHIIELKKLFRAHSGSTPVKIEFISADRSVGRIEIEAAWGIEHGKTLNEELRKISCVVDIFS
ncbi:MAG: DNA polymerase III subunit alpha [Chlamydiales bacterium]|nr:DNA polymerase III subunit alpha [Chlamydiales bacterium]